ncbi:hypothetical protein SteCoe_8298 [Stentor coeruleus]|uniref:Uncharacterized protein n=1 Tax=Stentor coeruleus TaxID=5963 RepID=A0A1R2CKF9_9CILI|nr:hypothetical protein SteCoe_8298 [Stentor coeruleus]
MEKNRDVSQDDVRESTIFQTCFPSKDETDLIYQDIEEYPNGDHHKIPFKRISDPKFQILCPNPLPEPSDNLKSTHILSILCPELTIKSQTSPKQSYYSPTNSHCSNKDNHFPISKPLYSSRSSRQINVFPEQKPLFKEPRQPTFTYLPGSSKSQMKIPSSKLGIKDTISPKIIENKYRASIGLNKYSSSSPPKEHLYTSPIFPITELKDENSDLTYTKGPDKGLENHEELKETIEIQEEISFKSTLKNQEEQESLYKSDKKIRTLGDILHIPRNRILKSLRPKTEHSPLDEKKSLDRPNSFSRRSPYNEFPSEPYRVSESISPSPRKSEVRNSLSSISKDWSPSFLHARNAIDQIKVTNSLRNSRSNSSDHLIRSSTPISLSPSVPSLKPEKLIKQFEAKVRGSQEISLINKKNHQRSKYLSVDYQHNSIDESPELKPNQKDSPKHRKCLSLYLQNSPELNLIPKLSNEIINQVDILCVNCYECIRSNDVDKHSKKCFKPIIGLPERFCVDERIKKLIKSISFHKNASSEINLKAYCKLEEYSEAIISQSMSSHMISEKIDEIYNESLTLVDGLPVGIMAKRLTNLLELKGQFTTQGQSDDLLKIYQEEAEKQKKELEKWKLRSELLLQLAANSSNQLHHIDSDIGSDTASVVSFSTGHSELVRNSEINFDIEQVLKAISAEELEKHFYNLYLKTKMSLPKSNSQQNTAISDLYKHVQQNNIPVSQWKEFISSSFNIH